MFCFRKSLFLMMVVFVVSCLGGERIHIEQFEDECCQALKNINVLTGTDFKNHLIGVVNLATNDMIRVDAMLVLSLVEYRLFLDSMDASHLQMWHVWSTNALNVATGVSGSRCWQYACARFLDAAYYAAKDDFQIAYEKSTNAIDVVSNFAMLNETNQLDCAVSNFYKMDEVTSLTSLKILAGASAAKMGYVIVATNLAEQVPEPHRTKILHFCP